MYTVYHFAKNFHHIFSREKNNNPKFKILRNWNIQICRKIGWIRRYSIHSLNLFSTQTFLIIVKWKGVSMQKCPKGCFIWMSYSICLYTYFVIRYILALSNSVFREIDTNSPPSIKFLDFFRSQSLVSQGTHNISKILILKIITS